MKKRTPILFRFGTTLDRVFPSALYWCYWDVDYYYYYYCSGGRYVSNLYSDDIIGFLSHVSTFYKSHISNVVTAIHVHKV